MVVSKSLKLVEIEIIVVDERFRTLMSDKFSGCFAVERNAASPMEFPSGSMMRTMSSFSKSPSIRVTPTGNILTACCECIAFTAPTLICNSPLANPSEWAIQRLMLDMGLAEGMNRVQIAELFSRKRSGKIFSFLPLAMMTSIPSSATLRAMLHLVSIPPRPKEDFPDCMYCDSS